MFAIIFSLLFMISSPVELPNVKLAFESFDERNCDIYMMESLDGKPVNLTNFPALDAYPNWSPDGRKIAFSSKRDGNWEIYVIDLETKEQRRLTRNSLLDTFPKWSPNGRMIAWNRNHDLYLMNPFTGRYSRLVEKMGVTVLTWFPGGREILFYSMSRHGFYLVDVQTGLLEELPRPPHKLEGISGFSVSPDGRKLVYASNHEVLKGSALYGLYMMDLINGEFKRLIRDPDGNCTFPCWSPDGRFIFFTSDNKEKNLDGVDIWIMTPEGEVVRQLKLEKANYAPDVFDPRYAYHSVSPEVNLKKVMWGIIKESR